MCCEEDITCWLLVCYSLMLKKLVCVCVLWGSDVCWQSANLKQNEVWSLVPACQRVCVWHYQFEEANLKMESAERAKLSQTSIYGLQIPIMPQEEMTDCTQSSLGLQFVIYIFEFLTHLQKQFYGCVGALSLSFWKSTLSSSAGQEHLNLLTASPTQKKKKPIVDQQHCVLDQSLSVCGCWCC